MSNFSETLKDLRINKGLRQEDVAKILDLSKQTISNYENGSREPNFDGLIKIANFFDVSMDYLFGTAQLGRNDITMDCKKTLENQLKLLSKCSQNCPPDELSKLTGQMVNIVTVLEPN